MEGGSSISEGTMSKETLEDWDRGVLAVLKASLSLHSLALACDLDLDPFLFLLPFLRSFNLDFLFGVLGVFCFFSTGGGGKARFKLDTDDVLEGGLYNM